MDRLFRIDFYPQDWIIDTSRLTPEERGIYIQIIALIYSNRGPIENDPAWIAGVSCCSVRMVKSVISKLLEKGFVQLSGGKITQKRAENELKIKRKHLENSAKGGRTSSEHGSKTPRKQCEINDECKENNKLASSEAGVSLPSPSPSPSPSPKDIEEKEPKGSKKKTKKPDDVSQSIWDDFIKLRAAKKAPVTETVLKAIQREADKIGWTLEQALSEACARGWQGFKSAWILREQGTTEGKMSTNMKNLKEINENGW